MQPAAPPVPSAPRSKSRLWLLVGAAIGGSVLMLLLLVLGAWLWFGRGKESRSDLAVKTESPSPSAPREDSATSAAPVAASPARRVPTEDLEDIQQKLRQIGLAFHNFHDTYRAFAPPRATASTESTLEAAPSRSQRSGPSPTALSWRVHLLPFLGQQPLYDQFHLDEPWDSPHNQSLLAHMPEVYRIGSAAEPTTRFQVITGPDMLFGHAEPARIASATDGTAHTILALATGPDRAVPWTKPDELTLDPAAPLASLGTLPDALISCVMADGGLLTLTEQITPADFLALATPHGGEIVDAGAYRRQFEEQFAEAAPPTSPSGSGTAAETVAALPPGAPMDIHARLQAIAFAFLLHNEHFGMYTHPAGTGEYDSGLSWRVHLLPFLGESELYRKFHLREPWDSPHNNTLLAEIPAVYRFDESPRTRVRVFSGPEMLFGSGRPQSVRDVRDGPTNTLLAAVVGPNGAVPWTHPGDLAFTPQNVADLVKSLDGAPIECALADGTLLTLPNSVPQETLTALITPAGGETLDVAALRKEHGPDYQPGTELLDQIQTALKRKNERLAKLKEVVLAMHNHHDTFRRFPLADNAKYFDAQGRPHLSWRVHLLPFLQQEPLYKQFKLDEPWDSPHNSALLVHMPAAFRDPQDAADSTSTRFVTLTGPNTPFADKPGPRLPDLRDGTVHTILVLIAGRDKAVPWTKPEDLPFDPQSPLACLGDLDGPGVYCAMADGAVHYLKSSLPPQAFQALVTPAGGEELAGGLANYGLPTSGLSSKRAAPRATPGSRRGS